MKRTYELMVILRPDYPVEDEKKLAQFLGRLVKGATISDISVMGKRALAFPITKHTQGIYVTAKIEGNVKVAELQDEFKMGTDVVRYLLTQKKG